MTRELLVLVAEAIDLGGRAEAVLDAPLEISLRSTTSVGGLTVVPAFTSEERLVEWATADDPWVAIPGEVLFQIVVSHDLDGVVIDAAAPEPLVVTRADCNVLLRRARD